LFYIVNGTSSIWRPDITADQIIGHFLKTQSYPLPVQTSPVDQLVIEN